MLLGVLAGLAAGALWGLTFVAPRAVAPYTELDLAVARYLAFGVVSLALMLHPRFRPAGIARDLWLTALVLGVTGYVCYYIAAAYAVRLAGPAIPPLVIGALPIMLAVIGNWRDRAVRWRALALPLSLILGGLAIVNVATLKTAETSAVQLTILLGTLCAVVALAVWILYALLNADALRQPGAPSPFVWTGLQGLGAAAGVLPLAPLALALDASAVPALGLANPEGLRFLAWALVLGIAASWVATWCWVVAASRLPVTLTGQLIVSETLFALLYGFLWEARWPTFAEASGAALLVAGVAFGVAAFRMAEPVGEIA